MGFLHPLALLALPLALLPLWLEWRGLRTGRPVRFSSVYLLERARRELLPSVWINADVEGSGPLGELFEDVLARAQEHVRREREALAAERQRIDATV